MAGATRSILQRHGQRPGALLLRQLGAIAIALTLAAVAGCGANSTDDPDPDAGIVGADGVVSIIDDTSRIVSLSGAITEILYELDLGDAVVAVDVTTVFPVPATKLPIVGVGRFLTAEAVLEQRPTLVIGDTQTSPSEAISQIRGAGVPVLITEVATSFDGLYRSIELIGDAVRAGDKAESLIDRMRTDIEAAIDGVEVSDPPSIAFVYSRGPDVILLFGAEMTTHPLIEAVGGVDAGAASGIVGTVDFTPEALVAAQPDVIIITSEGLNLLGGVDGLLATPGFAATPAGQQRRILDYPEGDILTLGPRIAEVLELLVADLYG